MSEWAPIYGETPIDPSDIKNRTIKTRAQLDAAEAENVRKAVVKYLAARPSRRKAPFDFAWLCRLHGEMFGDIFISAGQPRQHNVNLGDHWHVVPTRMMELVNDLAYWEEQGTYSLTEQAVRPHYRSVHIHPFANGNGRWARMLANIWLFQHSGAITQWPETLTGKESPVRREYIQHLQAADSGDLVPLIELHLRYTV
jgi:Fic-DOC domain mobile mystery protein B